MIGAARQASSRRSKLPRGLIAKVERTAVAHRDDASSSPPASAAGTTCGPRQVDVRVDRTRRRDETFARDDPGRTTRADDRRRPCVSGLPARPIAAMRPSLMPMRGLPDAEDGVDHDDVRDRDVERIVRRDGGRSTSCPRARSSPSRRRLAAGVGVVGLDLDDEIGVAEPDAVAGRRAVDGRVVGAGQVRHGQRTSSSTSAPGSMRIVAPAGSAGRAPPVPRAGTRAPRSRGRAGNASRCTRETGRAFRMRTVARRDAVATGTGPSPGISSPGLIAPRAARAARAGCRRRRTASTWCGASSSSATPGRSCSRRRSP